MLFLFFQTEKQARRSSRMACFPVAALIFSPRVSPPHGRRPHPDQKDWRKDPDCLSRGHPLRSMGHFSLGELYGITKSLYEFQIVWMVSLYCLPLPLSRAFLHEFPSIPWFPDLFLYGILSVKQTVYHCASGFRVHRENPGA